MVLTVGPVALSVCKSLCLWVGCDGACGCSAPPCETMELNVAAQLWLGDRTECGCVSEGRLCEQGDVTLCVCVGGSFTAR